MTAPAGPSTFTLTFGPYTDSQGWPAFGGMVGQIAPMGRVTNVLTGAAIVPEPIEFVLDAAGVAQVAGLPHSDHPSLSPSGFKYRVRWPGARGETPPSRIFSVPVAAGPVVDYDLLDAASQPGTVIPVVVGPPGPPGKDGKDGVSPVITALSADLIFDGTANKVMTADDRVLLHQVTPENMGWHTVRRDGTGWFSTEGIRLAAQPSTAEHATRKDYVDGIGTSLATPNTVVRRDVNGGARMGWMQVDGTPINATDAVNKTYADGLGATTATNNSIVRRTSNGTGAFTNVDISQAPTVGVNGTNKTYVDAQVAAAIVRAQMGNSPWSIGDAEPFPRPSNQVTHVSDFVTLSCFNAPSASVITKLSLPVETAGATMTWFQMALYSVAGNGQFTLVARTANNPTAAQTTGLQSLPLDITGGYPASFTFVPGQRYAFGLRCMGTTNPTTNSWFLFTSGQYAPYAGMQLFLGATTGLPVGPFTPGGTWWNAPYVVGLR